MEELFFVNPRSTVHASLYHGTLCHRVSTHRTPSTLVEEFFFINPCFTHYPTLYHGTLYHSATTRPLLSSLMEELFSIEPRTNVHLTLYHHATARKTRSSRAPKPKVVQIPIESAKSKNDDNHQSTAAVKIQKVFRGFLVRRNMQTIWKITAEVVQIENQKIHLKPKDQLRVGKKLTTLLQRLNAVRGVRVFRKKVVRLVIDMLQETIDSLESSAGDLDDTDDEAETLTVEVSDSKDFVRESKTVEVSDSDDFVQESKPDVGMENTVNSTIENEDEIEGEYVFIESLEDGDDLAIEILATP